MEGCYKFILEILMLRIEPRKCSKSYTYIHFFREHSSVFYLRFSIFHSNQTDEISNIYNYPRGRGATQTIILRTVNCNGSFWTSSKRTPIKALDGKIQKTIQTRLNRLEETAYIEDYKKIIFSRKEGILSRVITEELDLLYKNMYSENSPGLDKIYIQIFD